MEFPVSLGYRASFDTVLKLALSKKNAKLLKLIIDAEPTKNPELYVSSIYYLFDKMPFQFFTNWTERKSDFLY